MRDRVALVTGGGSGIGRATAELFREEGGSVLTLDLSGGDIDCDVSDEDQVRAAVDTAAARFGRVDVLFNAAGIALRQPVDQQTVEEWDRCFDVNVRGTFLCSKHVLAHMSSGGSIVHAASVTGITGVRDRAAYSATKGAVVALTRNMAMDLASRGIRVNCVCPGFVRTPFIGGILKDPARTERLTAMHPLGRLGEPEDIARAVLFLASTESSWITGQAIAVDGGFSAGYASEI